MRPEVGLASKLILAIDTSAAHCAAALLWGDAGATRIVTRSEDMAKGQAERLVPMVADLMAANGVTWADLTGLAVGVGPGNFTGIRIAVAFVRGLALARAIPAIGVTGFEALASGQTAPFWTAIAAPRDQTYVQGWGVADGAPRLIQPGDIAALPGTIHRMADLSPADLVTRVAQVASAKSGQPNPRPAPYYLRAADAAPPSDPAPVILP